MPARREEIHHALDEGVRLELLASPMEFLGDENGSLRALKVQRMELGEPDDSGRRRPVPVPDETFEIETDMSIIAVGTGPNRILLDATPGLGLNKWGYVQVNEETGETSIPNVFAGGDIVTGRGHGHPGHGCRTPRGQGDCPAPVAVGRGIGLQRPGAGNNSASGLFSKKTSRGGIIPGAGLSALAPIAPRPVRGTPCRPPNRPSPMGSGRAAVLAVMAALSSMCSNWMTTWLKGSPSLPPNALRQQGGHAHRGRPDGVAQHRGVH